MWSYWWCKICLVTLGSLQISSGRLPTVACPHVTSPAVGSVIRTMVQLGFHSVELQVCQNAITSLIRSGWTQSVLRVQSCIDAVSHGKWDLSDCKINELMKHHKAKLDLITSSYNRLLSTSTPLHLVWIRAPWFDEALRAIYSTKSLTDHRLYH